MKKILFFALIGVLLLGACSAGGDVEVHGAWARSTLAGGNGAVYMVVHNHSNVDDAILGASSDVADAVEIHLSEMDANGVMSMTRQESIALPVDTEVVFKPGGYHIMMVGLKKDLKVGDEIVVILNFQNHEDIVLKVPVMDMADDAMDHNSMP